MQQSTEQVLALPVPDPTFAAVNPRFFEAQLDPEYDFDGLSTYDGLAVIEMWAHFALDNMTDDLQPWARSMRHAHAIVGVWLDALEERMEGLLPEGIGTDAGLAAVADFMAMYRQDADAAVEPAIQARRDLIWTVNAANKFGQFDDSAA